MLEESSDLIFRDVHSVVLREILKKKKKKKCAVLASEILKPALFLKTPSLIPTSPLSLSEEIPCLNFDKNKYKNLLFILVNFRWYPT